MRIKLLAVVLWVIEIGHAQSNDYYPTFMNAYFQNMAQITPAHIPKDARLNFTSGYRSLTGAFSNISGYYFTGGKVFRPQTHKSHLLRLQFYNEKEGSYISSPRVYANYAIELPLIKDIVIYSGAAMGTISTFYASPSTTQSSTTRPDASLGLGIKSEKFDLGASMMQATNSRFMPFQSVITYRRFYHVYGSYIKEFQNRWGVKGRMLWRHMANQPEELTGTLSALYNQRLEGGFNISQHKGLSVFVMADIHIENDVLQLLVNYNTSYSPKTPLWQNSVEIGLSYIAF